MPASTRPENLNRFWPAQIVCGEDWKFGFKAAGNASTLQDICRENSLEAEVVGKIYVDGVRVSSTRVRDALTEGDMSLVARLLGRPHQVRGTYDPARRVVTAVENMCPGEGTYGVLARSAEVGGDASGAPH